MENQSNDKRQTVQKSNVQKPNDEIQKVLKGEPLGDVLKEWATKKR